MTIVLLDMTAPDDEEEEEVEVEVEGGAVMGLEMFAFSLLLSGISRQSSVD